MYTTLGALIFQQMLDLTDEETVEQLAFNVMWHFALDLDGESDAAKYICPRTLWTMRGILTRKEFDTALFFHVTDKLAKIFSVVYTFFKLLCLKNMKKYIDSTRKNIVL